MKFLSAQFEPSNSRSRFWFDLTFGIIVPILCILLDPVVFRGGFEESGLLESSRPFAFCVMFISMVALLDRSLTLARAAKASHLLGGFLLAGALYAFGLGILLLPFTIIGMLLLIGILGLTPFITAFVYYRNAALAFNADSVLMPRWTLWKWGLTALLLSFTASIGMQLATSAAVGGAIQVIQAGTGNVSGATTFLKNVEWLSGRDDCQFRIRFDNATDETAKSRLLVAFKQAYDRDIMNACFHSD